ncbi:MAG: Trk system potassium transporter TrkA [Alphaproteobacteria bacterium]|nr:Trk system potassium transporter TrkA [Alphaproteobacteria bacterium]
MKIIVCGATQVGKSAVSYLVKGNNDIIVIDENPRNLDDVSKEFDVLPVLGKPSHPDILERAGAKDCDMILALTESDEVNMIICQLAYTLFDIPKKIASVNSETFTDPLWGMLYNDNHIPVDLLISPNIDIAEQILKILQYPGCAGILPVFDGKYSIVTLNINENCPLLNIPLVELSRQDDFHIGFVNIIRDNVSFLPDMYDVIQNNDQINILVEAEKVYNAISIFGMEKPANERLVVFGGNEISEYIGNKIENDDTIISSRLVEEDLDKARILAKNLNRTVVIQGEMMNDVILKEADLTHADAVIAVTDNDKDNLLASLMAAKSGVSTTISVINTPSSSNLMFNNTDNILINRSSITISGMLKEIRKAKLRQAYSIARGMGEIWEIKLSEDVEYCHKRIGELNLPKMCRVVGVLRGNELIHPDPTSKFELNDLLLIYVDSTMIKQAEHVFC